MTQERYQEYRKELKSQGFNHIDIIVDMPNEKTFKTLEQIFGSTPWDWIKENG